MSMNTSPMGTDDVVPDDAFRPPLVVVDAANVVGSVPDGWWRDRAGATERLRDSLAGIAAHGLLDTAATTASAGTDDSHGWPHPPPYEVVLVVEGAARRVTSAPNVRVVAASGSGDDAIVKLVAGEGGGRPVLVVTADRGLRARVVALGAVTVGPSAVRASRGSADRPIGDRRRRPRR